MYHPDPKTYLTVILPTCRITWTMTWNFLFFPPFFFHSHPFPTFFSPLTPRRQQMARRHRGADASPPTPLTVGGSITSPIPSGVASPLSLCVCVCARADRTASPLSSRRSGNRGGDDDSEVARSGRNLVGSGRDLGRQVGQWRAKSSVRWKAMSSTRRRST